MPINPGRISFPRNEWPAIRRRLAATGWFYTTRVSRELGLYRKDRRYLAPWRQVLRVESIRRLRNLADHPFFDQLTTAQKRLISKFGTYEVIKLSGPDQSGDRNVKSMYDVITIGSATRDIFIRSSALEVRDSDRSPGGVDACFPLGAKIEIKELVLETGGGATNAAVTFGRLGWRVAAMTAIGRDANGQDVLAALKKDGVSAALVQTDFLKQTALSIIALAGSGERTVLVYRGASENIRAGKIRWNDLKAKWFYITSLGGKIELLQKILGHAAKNGIRVAWNPGSAELRNGLEKLSVFIKQVDVFNLNLEEAMQLTGRTTRDVKKLFGDLRGLPRRAAIITDGINGAYADDGRRTWHSRVLEVERINTTGAGDSFGSGLVAGLMKKDDLPYALAVATINATGVVQQMGAKRGIMRRYPTAAQVKRVPISPWS